MNWSAHILGLLGQGYSVPDVVTLADNPFITEAYVKAVKRMVMKRYVETARHPYVITTSEDMRKIDAYAKEIGGGKKFLREYRKIKSSGLARKIGVSAMQIKNYVYRYLRTPKRTTSFRGKFSTYEAKLVSEGKLKAPDKKVTLEEMKTLW